MRIQVLHDREGNICGIFAPEEGNRRGGIQLDDSDDRTVIEVDAPDITVERKSSEQGNYVGDMLAHLLENYRVSSGRLVERSGDSSSTS